jgi:DNA topoisomerase-1
VSARRVVQVVDAVAGVLGNTRAVCRKSYIHPGIIECFTNGGSARCGAGSASMYGHAQRTRHSAKGLSADECAVLAILRSLSKREKRKAA